jgi:hypothetical protein
VDRQFRGDIGARQRQPTLPLNSSAPGSLSNTASDQPGFCAHVAGMDLYLDPGAIDREASAKVREMLRDAMTALEKREEGVV